MTHEPATLLWGLALVLSPVWFPVAVMLLMELALWANWNISTKKVGGLRFIKLGRICFSFCVTKQYKPMA